MFRPQFESTHACPFFSVTNKKADGTDFDAILMKLQQQICPQFMTEAPTMKSFCMEMSQSPLHELKTQLQHSPHI